MSLIRFWFLFIEYDCVTATFKVTGEPIQSNTTYAITI